MDFKRISNSFILSQGSNWTSSTGATFKGLGPTGSDLRVMYDNEVKPGEVITQIDTDQQFLVVYTDYAATHKTLSVEKTTHFLGIQRVQEGAKDFYGRPHTDLVTIADGVPAVLQGRFSTSTDQEPDRPIALSRGLFLLSDGVDVKEHDIIMLDSIDTFKVVEKLRALPGIVTIKIETIN